MIIGRYLIKEIYKSTFSILLVLVATITLYSIMRYLNAAAKGYINIQFILQILTLELPTFIGLLLPISTIIGVMVVLLRLITNNEMVVILSSGKSRMAILTNILLAAALLSLLTGYIAIFWGPNSATKSIQVRNDSISNMFVNAFTGGKFYYRNNNNSVIYAKNMDQSSKVARDIFIADVKQDGTWNIVTAKQARVMQNDEYFFELEQGRKTTGKDTNLDLQTMEFASYFAPLPVTNHSKKYTIHAVTTPKLWSKAQQNNLRAIAELHWRLAQPLAVLVMALLAAAIVMANYAKTRVIKIISLMSLYILYISGLFFGKSSIINGSIPASFGLWWIHIAYVVLALAIFNNRYLTKIFMHKYK